MLTRPEHLAGHRPDAGPTADGGQCVKPAAAQHAALRLPPGRGWHRSGVTLIPNDPELPHGAASSLPSEPLAAVCLCGSVPMWHRAGVWPQQDAVCMSFTGVKVALPSHTDGILVVRVRYSSFFSGCRPGPAAAHRLSQLAGGAARHRVQHQPVHPHPHSQCVGKVQYPKHHFAMQPSLQLLPDMLVRQQD